jgi:hypothetical protein
MVIHDWDDKRAVEQPIARVTFQNIKENPDGYQ